jgi:choline/glycine/proline betaine transport protein
MFVDEAADVIADNAPLPPLDVSRVEVTESPVPTYGGRMVGNWDRYARLEVHLDEGGQDYDVMGYTKNQVIHDCLDQYERHLAFLRLA